MKIEVKDGKTGVAVSGGIDSMVLLRLYMESGADFCVINVEHGIRGENSVKDSEFVAEFCLNNGIECHIERIDALSYAKDKKISVELAARELRYAVFERYLQENAVKRIALAHHADDNAETVLMRIFRGTGIKGLRGIESKDRYIRPLLGYTRKEIEEYAEKNGVSYVTDETNFDCDYMRNFIRHSVLPVIEERYPNVQERIARLSKNAEEVDKYLEKQAIVPEQTDGGLILKGLFKVDDVIKKYSVSGAMKKLGAYKDVEYVNFSDILSLESKENNSSFDMPFGITALKHGDDLCLYRKSADDFAEEPFSKSKNYDFCGFSYKFIPKKEIVAGLTFDGDKVKNCVVRKRKDGDRFCRVNGKNKLLSDFLNEKKLSKKEKEELLVIAEGQRVYVILGLEVAEEAKIDEKSTNILYTVKERKTYDE